MICRKTILRFPIPIPRLLEHKNADFVLETPENGGSEGKKRTKTSILCSKCPKTPKAHKNLDFVLGRPENEGSEGKNAQKPRFCAREARKSEQWVSARFVIDVDY